MNDPYNQIVLYIFILLMTIISVLVSIFVNDKWVEIIVNEIFTIIGVIVGFKLRNENR